MADVRNVEVTVEGAFAVIRVRIIDDAGHYVDYGPTSSGKNMLVGSSAGPLKFRRDGDQETIFGTSVSLWRQLGATGGKAGRRPKNDMLKPTGILTVGTPAPPPGATFAGNDDDLSGGQ